MYDLIHNYPPMGGPSYYTLLAVDPGSTTIGFCVFYIDIATQAIVGHEAFTVDASKRAGGIRYDDELAEQNGDLFVRLNEIDHQFTRILNYYKPLTVACEAPFFSRLHPNAYEVLVAVVTRLRYTYYRWCATKPMHMIETTVAKKVIAPKSEPLKSQSKAIAVTKDRIRFNALNCPEINFLNVNLLDEHSLDAALVGYAHYLRFILGRPI